MSFVVNRTRRIVFSITLLYGLIIFISAFSAEFKISQLVVYIHPVFRVLEFMVGMYVAKLFIANKNESNYSLLYAIIAFVTLIFTVPILYKNNFAGNIKFGSNYVYYTIITIPTFILIVYHLANIKNNFTEKLKKSKILSTLSGLTFPLFIWQFFAVLCTKKYFIDSPHSLLYLFAINLIFALITYLLFDKLLANFLRKKLLNNN